MHSIVQRPMVVAGGKIEARPMMYVALTYDHRLVDGREVREVLSRRAGTSAAKRTMLWTLSVGKTCDAVVLSYKHHWVDGCQDEVGKG
jgi:hypothetical protein